MARNVQNVDTSSTAGAKALVFAPEQFKQFASLAQAFHYNAAENPSAIAYDQAQRDAWDESGKRQYKAITHAACQARVLKIASFLESIGVAPGARVAILSLERPEWTEAEMAIYTVGATLVPVYLRDTEDRLDHILRGAAVSFAFAENEQQCEKLLRLAQAPHSLNLRHLICFQDAEPSRQANFTTLTEILAAEPEPRDERTFAWAQTQPDDVACIYYTSGSSGEPKGVPATHRQILANLYQIAAAGLVDYDELRRSGSQPLVTFLLPERAHAYPARSAQLVFTTPARARYPAVVDPTHSEIDEAYRQSVRQDLREGGAGMIPVVPKIAIAIEQRVRQRLARGGLRERLARWIVESDVAKSLRKVQGQRRLLDDGLHWLVSPLRRRIARRIRREIVGPQFGYFISGGAKLPLETAAFLHAISLPIYEGYGSTETNCAIASGTPAQHRLGSVGKPYGEVEVKIDPVTRELLVKGPNVVSGYLHGDEESSANWDNAGWYHTRDIAALDGDGFLQIEGRLDQMLVLLNGENVSPLPIENRCASISGVESVIVLGDHRDALVALFALNEEAVQQWAAAHGYQLAIPWQHDARVVAWLRGEVERQVNERAGHPYECVRHVAIIDLPSIADETLTATEKVRRKAIESRYAQLIDQLYAEHEKWLTPRQSQPLPLRRVAAF